MGIFRIAGNASETTVRKSRRGANGEQGREHAAARADPRTRQKGKIVAHIRQIMPATGWRVVYVSYDEGESSVIEEPVVCFALLEPPNSEREDGPQEQ